MKSWLEGLAHIFFPNLCPACGNYLPLGCPVVCLSCEAKLPFTGYHMLDENPFTDRFMGRVPLKSGSAMLHFTKGGKTQELLHHIKYRGRQKLAFAFGEWYGETLKAKGATKVDLIIPVPLHQKKMKKRGFNQSDAWGQGLGKVLGVPCSSQFLLRVRHTDTQTRMSRMERLLNVEKAFELKQCKDLEGKHILLVDDVLTTGATLEACGQKILEIEGTSLSMATLAIAVE